MSLLVVEPVFATRVWGGSTLRRWYRDKVPDGVIGECWAVSGLPGSSGTVSHGAAGGTLAEAWRAGLITGEPRDDDFPLLCKILDPADWLSVQVHPDDEQARALEGQPRGKAECWYVLQCEPGAELIMGHRRGTARELRADLAAGVLMDQLIRHEVRPGSFFMVPAGCVHAVGPGILVYEVQQSSDLTYRLFDFDRAGLDGTPRALHVDKGFDVVTAPFNLADSLTAGDPVTLAPGVRRQTLVENPHFTVSRWDIDGRAEVLAADYAVITVIEGSGSLRAGADTVDAARATSLVLPRGAGPLRIEGTLSLMLTEPGPRL